MRLLQAASTSIGSKILIALTGLALGIFLVGHLAGNLLFLAGPDAFNQYALLANQANTHLATLAKDAGLPVVATCDAHYPCKDDAGPHEALLAIQTRDTLDKPNRFKFGTQEFYLKSGAEMLQAIETKIFQDAAFVPLHWQNLAWAARKGIILDKVVNALNFPYLGDLVIE